MAWSRSRSMVRGDGADLQPEPEARESTTALKNLLCGTSAEDPQSKDLHSYRPGELITGPTSLYRQAWH